MLRRMLFPLILGLGGIAMLLGLGIWQVQRLHWKEGVIAAIDARIGSAPEEVPAVPDPATDRYLAVTATGTFTGDEVDVLSSEPNVGAGYRVMAVLETGTGRRLLVDRGFIPETSRGLPHEAQVGSVTGNLLWPVEVDRFTPPPDPRTGIWFARDVPALARTLRTEPFLIVASSETGDAIAPVRVDSSDIPNDHTTYAITWFSLAVVWAGMTGLLLWRIRQRQV